MLHSHFLQRILPHNFLIVDFFGKKYLKLKLSKLYRYIYYYLLKKILTTISHKIHSKNKSFMVKFNYGG